MWYQQGVFPDEMLTDSLVIDGLDYARFKLFHLSVLWRASISTGRMFEKIHLDADAERIRQMLLSEDPGDEDQYGLFAEVPVDDASPRVLHEFVMQPLQSEPPGHKMCIFLFGGCIWYYVVATNTREVFAPYLFSKAGQLILRKRTFSGLPFIRDLPKGMQRQPTG
jgi:hypothetical protein